MFERFINASEVMSRPVCDPRDPYGPPLIKYMLRVRDRDTGKWWYVRTFTRSRDDRRYTFTSDPTYARMMSLRSAACTASAIAASSPSSARKPQPRAEDMVA